MRSILLVVISVFTAVTVQAQELRPTYTEVQDQPQVYRFTSERVHVLDTKEYTRLTPDVEPTIIKKALQSALQKAVKSSVSEMLKTPERPEVAKQGSSARKSKATEAVFQGLKEPSEFVVYFDFDSAALREDQRVRLEQYLKHLKGKTVMVEGHASPEGTDEYNLALGRRRAETIAEYLNGKGIEVKEIQSFGESRCNKPARKWPLCRKAVIKQQF